MSDCSETDDIRSNASVPKPSAAANGPISHAIFRVARLHRMLAGNLLRQIGLHPSQELVMMQLWDAGPQRQTDLVRLLDSDAATMTRTVQRLEAAGFVRRRSCESDKRVTIIEPTAASLSARPGVEKVWGELENGVIRDLEPDQQMQLLAMLETAEISLSRTAADRG